MPHGIEPQTFHTQTGAPSICAIHTSAEENHFGKQNILIIGAMAYTYTHRCDLVFLEKNVT